MFNYKLHFYNYEKFNNSSRSIKSPESYPEDFLKYTLLRDFILDQAQCLLTSGYSKVKSLMVDIAYAAFHG